MELQTTGLAHNGDNVVERRSQDLSGILGYTNDQRRDRNTGSSDMKYAARVPAVVIEQYLAKTGISFVELMSSAGESHWRAILNDPANDLFRIWKGKV